MKQVAFNDGDIVFHQGDSADRLIVVLQGEIVLTVFREATPAAAAAAAGGSVESLPSASSHTIIGSSSSSSSVAAAGVQQAQSPSRGAAAAGGGGGGSSREVLRLGPGQHIGEVALVGPMVGPATAKAKGQVREGG